MIRQEKAAVYSSIRSELAALLKGLEDPVAVMASAAAVIHGQLSYSSWTGFYRVVAPDLLRVGPYQGPVGCIDIPFGGGVCGSAARDERTYVVPDVHAFPGHIACDAAARSEIVVPVFAADGTLAAVLDLDSQQPAAFDEEDRRALEDVAKLLRQHL